MIRLINKWFGAPKDFETLAALVQHLTLTTSWTMEKDGLRQGEDFVVVNSEESSTLEELVHEHFVQNPPHLVPESIQRYVDEYRDAASKLAEYELGQFLVLMSGDDGTALHRACCLVDDAASAKQHSKTRALRMIANYFKQEEKQ